MESLHRRNKAIDNGVIRGGKDFVSNEDADYVGGWNVRCDICFDPLLGELEICEIWDQIVWDSNSNGDSGVRKGL